MKVKLEKYRGKRICVAVSGGKDSMALLYFLNATAQKFGITLSALNCDHAIRGKASKRDSAFVKEECEKLEVPLITFVWETNEPRTENAARLWRQECYKTAACPHELLNGVKWQGADFIATAHHQNDNAETVLFNLARGSSLAGLKGITDTEIEFQDGEKVNLIRPLIECSRGDIDGYITENGISFVTDESNFTDDYTRNKIRRNVLPELEKAVNGACNSIYRFSRLAADDEEYFGRKVQEILKKRSPYGYEISLCQERVIFKRAVAKIIAYYGLKDYTGEQLERVFILQNAENGKRFEFLGLTAFKESQKISVCVTSDLERKNNEINFYEYLAFGRNEFCGKKLKLCKDSSGVAHGEKALRFDLNALPENSVIRFAQKGDRFVKFGGGGKKLGDYFTDKKIPRMLRGSIPVIAHGDEVLCVCGVEISDKIKITENTANSFVVIADDYAAKN